MPLTKLVCGYVSMVGLPLVLLFFVLAIAKDSVSHGPTLPAPIISSKLPKVETPEVFVLLRQIIVIIALARCLRGLFRFIGQPQVVGEVVAGIMLGPSFLGGVAPGLSAALFPVPSIPYLETVSELGLVLFMFLVGLSVNPKHLKDYGHAAILTSHVSMIVPFALGVTLALYIYPSLAGGGVSFTVFACFMGGAMSTTAFPVLARILKERSLMHTKVGTVAMACAAVDDVTGWCILACLTILIRHGSMPPWLTVIGSVAFVAFMFLIVKPLVRRCEHTIFSDSVHDETPIVASVFLLLGSALVTEILGIHLLFGSFLAGLVMPRNPRFVAHLHAKFEALTLLLFLPLFFAFTGLRTSIRLIHGSQMLFVCAAIIAVAVIGKAGGSTIAARVAGMSWRDAAMIGALLNTRGLMELVVLNIGLDLQVIKPGLFAMMVLMGVITTLMTAPLLRWITLARVATVSVCNLDEIREVV